MISTAVFSWKRPAALSLHEALLWAGSVNYARRTGMTAVLVADERGVEDLTALGIPFDRVLPLPKIPDTLDHIRDLVKLYALRKAMLYFGPCLHVDFDVFLGQPLPPRILAAPMAGEFFYTPEDSVTIFNQVADVRAKMGRPGVPSPRGLAGGIFGGNDTDGILAVIDASLDLALAPENRKAMIFADGYTGSVMIGEMAFGHAYPDAELLLPNGPLNQDAYFALDYVHVAGHKANPDKLNAAARRIARNFPAEFDETCRRWRMSQ